MDRQRTSEGDGFKEGHFTPETETGKTQLVVVSISESVHQSLSAFGLDLDLGLGLS